MPTDREYEKKISIRDLFFHILYKWRSILIAALVCAVLLGGYAYISNRNRTGGSVQAVSGAADETGSTGTLKSNYEASNALYQSLLDDNISYREKSVVMRIDPYQVWKATASYAVVSDGGEIASDTAYNPMVPIAAAYTTLVFDKLDTDRLKTVYGDADLNYVNEAVTVVPPASNASSFNVTVIGLTREMADEALKCVEETVEKVSQGSVQQMGKHRVVLLSRYVCQTVDTDIETRQAAVAKNIAVYQDAITDNETSISKAPSAVKNAGKTSRKPWKLYTAAGFVLGALFLVCLYGAGYLFSGKLRKAGELTERFGVPVYGALNHSRARRPGKGPDRLIEKWEFRKTRADADTVLESVCALIREQNEGSILLTGTIPTERIGTVADRLSALLGDSARIAAEGSFLNNSRAITEAQNAAAVIIVEETHQSETEDIRRMLEMLRLGKTPPAGAVTV